MKSKQYVLLALTMFLGLTSFAPVMSIPLTNAKVVEYVKNAIGKKVGRGECWDLASEALDYADAKWEAPYNFGKKVNYKTEKLMPGDVIQATDVVMENKTETSITRWKMAVHTAVVYEVKADGEIVIAEQNVDGVRKVMTNTWNLNHIKSGKMEFYRPQPK
jgi:hypothetical protein